jgi:hypothetical protein
MKNLSIDEKHEIIFNMSKTQISHLKRIARKNYLDLQIKLKNTLNYSIPNNSEEAKKILGSPNKSNFFDYNKELELLDKKLEFENANQFILNCTIDNNGTPVKILSFSILPFNSGNDDKELSLYLTIEDFKKVKSEIKFRVNYDFIFDKTLIL